MHGTAAPSVRPSSTDEAFQGYLNELVWPLLRIVRATLPQMIERRSGKIVAVTSSGGWAT
ncbi:MAG: hypothetical protein JO130_18270 [Solirubrobacterales bacterium]|nr:hypothetical protein [Solirubrobacterales bacterium]